MQHHITYATAIYDKADILCPGSSDESDRGFLARELRDEKIRRRVDIANAYRDGNQLFIQTARLRGPFESPWINPWKREGSCHDKPGLEANAKAAGGSKVAYVKTEPLVPLDEDKSHQAFETNHALSRRALSTSTVAVQVPRSANSTAKARSGSPQTILDEDVSSTEQYGNSLYPGSRDTSTYHSKDDKNERVREQSSTDVRIDKAHRQNGTSSRFEEADISARKHIPLLKKRHYQEPPSAITGHGGRKRRFISVGSGQQDDDTIQSARHTRAQSFLPGSASSRSKVDHKALDVAGPSRASLSPFTPRSPRTLRKYSNHSAGKDGEAGQMALPKHTSPSSKAVALVSSPPIIFSTHSSTCNHASNHEVYLQLQDAQYVPAMHESCTPANFDSSYGSWASIKKGKMKEATTSVKEWSTEDGSDGMNMQQSGRSRNAKMMNDKMNAVTHHDYPFSSKRNHRSTRLRNVNLDSPRSHLQIKIPSISRSSTQSSMYATLPEVPDKNESMASDNPEPEIDKLDNAQAPLNMSSQRSLWSNLSSFTIQPDGTIVEDSSVDMHGGHLQSSFDLCISSSRPGVSLSTTRLPSPGTSRD